MKKNLMIIATGIDRDGTERWFDLNGHQLSGKPTKKGVYIQSGKKQVVK